MNDGILDPLLIEDFAEDFMIASRLDGNLEGTFNRLKRRHPDDVAEIKAAWDQVAQEVGLDNSQTHNATYDRTGNSHRWYKSGLATDVHWPQLRTKIEADLGEAIIGIDDSSTNVMNGLRASGIPQNTRGLVLGYVQSGKTTNFMSVIAKAADSGFRLIIVLTGITDNLRQQTQDRIDEQLITPLESRWTRLTDHDNDFSGDKNPQKLGKPGEHFIAVVKKNRHRLRRLNEWIDAAGNAGDTCPILVIDDEADQASINVSKRSKDDRSAINAQISQLLNHQTTAYIAYTATPFANILIDPNNVDDLFPRDFMVTLPEPDGYFGSRKLFGRAPINGEDPEKNPEFYQGYDMIRTIAEDEVESIRPKKSSDGVKEAVTGGPALHDAIRWFVMATAARRARGQVDKHSSMLIHTSMLTQDHEDLEFVVKNELSKVKKELSDSGEMDSLRNVWEEEANRVPADQFDLSPVSFEAMMASVPDVLNDVEVVVDNGTSSNRLKYDSEDGEESKTATVIAIGGNTLSRGLTLEGLISSYFVRNASAYDTLLQMGRWFGFRKGYQDLPRVWMPDELRSWFYDLATIEAELREELSVFMDMGIKPLEVQTRIRQHPDMQITSKAKMQDAEKASMSFSGRKEQTIKFKHKDKDWLSNNIDASKDLLGEIQARGIEQEVGLYGSPVFRKVPPQLVMQFLDNYLFHEDTRLGQDQARYLKKYIEKETDQGRLRHWNVSVITQDDAAKTASIDLGLAKTIKTLSRSKLSKVSGPDANVKAIITTSDRLNDVVLGSDDRRDNLRAEVRESSKASSRARGFKGTGVSESVVRKLHKEYVGNSSAHLALYPIDKDSKPMNWVEGEVNKDAERQPLEAEEHVIGVGIFFPESLSSDSGVEYYTAPEPDPEILARYVDVEEEVNSINDKDELQLEGKGPDDLSV